jgi:flagellar motor switch protein FliN/FliY
MAREDSELDEDLFGSSAKKKDSRKAVIGNDDEEEIPHGEVDYLHDVPLSMQAQIGSVQKTMREILKLKAGSVIEFDKVVGEPMDVLIGGRLMCRGEIVVVNERYGIRISEVIRAEDSQREMDNL